MPELTPEYIKNLVSHHKEATQSRRDRQDEDYRRWRLEEYDSNTVESNTETGDAYRNFTSNEPRTFLDRVASLISSSNMLIKVPHVPDEREERERHSAKERFLMGCFKQADERLVKFLQPKHQKQHSWLGPIRGWLAGRVLIVKPPDGKTYADITPWDIRNTYWGLGANGLKWACYHTQKTVQEIQDEYGVKLDGNEEHEEDIYDFYDETHNTLIAGDQVIKSPTVHGAKEVPVIIVPIGPNPQVFQDNITDTERDVGESVYQGNRTMFDQYNEVLSLYLELVAKARDQGFMFHSKNAERTLESDPNEPGVEVDLDLDEKLERIPLAESTQDAAIIHQVVQGMLQRGGLPFAFYGELNFAISGYAINQLKQSIFAIIHPLLEAMNSFYYQACNMLVDQYITGKFKPMALSGRDANRRFFMETIKPKDIKNLPAAEIKFVPTLPQDDAAKMNLAMMAKEAQLLDDRSIWEDVLEVPDTDKMEDALKIQKAVQVSPLAAAYDLMMAAENQNRPDIAQIYMGELQVQMLTQLAQLTQLQMGLAQMGVQPGQQNGAKPSQPRTSTLPQQARGGPEQPDFQQSGPVVPPGTPRPGAQNRPGGA